MIVDPALEAARTRRNVTVGEFSGSSGGASEIGSFGATLQALAAEGGQQITTGEKAAISGLAGQTPAATVVASVLAAEETLQAGLAIRDKLIGAFQELSHMSI